MNDLIWENRVLVDVIKLRCSHPGLRWVLIQHDYCPYKRYICTERDRQSGECHVKTDAENGVKHLHAKEFQGSSALPEAKRNTEQSFSHSLQKETNPADNLISDFWPLEL